MMTATNPGSRLVGAAALPASAPTPTGATFGTLARWSIATSALLYVCNFPLNWGWLGWVALVPLCVLIRTEARTRPLFFASWVGGLFFFFPALQWMRVADARMYITWFMLATYVSFYFPTAVFLLRALDRRRVPLVVALPVVWTALELLRAHLLGGFAWYYLGHTQHDFLPIIQIADVAGAYGVTFLVAAVNAVAFEWLWRALRPASAVRRPVLVLQSALVLLSFVGCFAYGSARMNAADFRAGPKLALLQGNVAQQIKNEKDSTDEESRQKALDEMTADYNTLNQLAARQKPDLIAYPETSFMKEWISVVAMNLTEIQRNEVKKWEEESQIIAAEHRHEGNRPHVLLGLNTSEIHPGQQPPIIRYNSALLIDPDGAMKGRYDKMHRVPFGEYVPLRDVIPFMDKIAPYDYDYSIAAGRELTQLPLGKHRFGVLICYEDTDTVLARNYVDPDAYRQADFLVNLSNDGWFDGTEQHEQHLAICRFRAVEARRSVARSVNMGISAVIDGNGRVLAPTSTKREDKAMLWRIDGKAEALPTTQWGDFKKVAGVLVANVPLDNRESLYARFGDWLPWACCGTLFLTLIVLRVRPTAVATT